VVVAPSRSAATATAKKTKADCNPNFILDAHGNKIFKPECF
jgi:hypothetical protein